MERQAEFERAYEQLERWLGQKDLSPKLHRELSTLMDCLVGGQENKEIREDIYDRFYRDLEFGTAGLRGLLGAGSNRMNLYTVRRATQGFANYILSLGNEAPSAAIAYDSRTHSDRFALETASVLMANGIKVYLYPELMPTPALSFAVRYYGCQGGVMITASHNPSTYNGYKAYNSQGCQISGEQAAAIMEEIEKIDLFSGVKLADVNWENCRDGFIRNEAGTVMLEIIPPETVDAYMAEIKRRSTGTSCSNLEVVYTPLNGTGNKPVRRILEEIGVKTVHVVKEQEKPDGNFPTCPYPNPEKREALRKGLDLCEELGTADLLVATDPDADRMGVAVAVQDRTQGKTVYRLLTGNEIGILLLSFLCVKGPHITNPVAVRTIVSSKMADAVASHYGVEMRQVLTGFKYIGEQIAKLEETGEEGRFLFGFEESYGFLSGAYVRDKDGVLASMLICEMAAYYKEMGKTLVDRLEELYRQFGFYKNAVEEFAFDGAKGMAVMEGIMSSFRQELPQRIMGKAIYEKADYLNSVRKSYAAPEEVIDLPKANVFELTLDDGSSIMARPSGTEPKLKIYLSAKGLSEAHAEKEIEEMKREIRGWIRIWTK